MTIEKCVICEFLFNIDKMGGFYSKSPLCSKECIRTFKIIVAIEKISDINKMVI